MLTPRAGPLRVFFALWPDAAARGRMAALARDVARQSGGREPRPENHHVTLAFVGEVASARIADLERVGAAAAQSAGPFTLSLDRLGGFRATGIAWLGTGLLPPELGRLVQALRDALAAAAFPVERRPYRAHVTLARHCRAVAPAAVEPVTWRVDRVTLAASELRPEGSRYRELAAWPLARML